MATDGLCKLLSGLAGNMPTQTIAAISVPAVQLTGVGARRVGIAVGGVLIIAWHGGNGVAFLFRSRS